MRNQRPYRESMMERRLRKARGEEVPDELEFYGAYEDDDEDRPRGFGDGPMLYARTPGGYGGGGPGCGQGLIFGALALIAGVLIGALFLNQGGGLFPGVPSLPDVREIIITPTPRVINSAAVVQRVRQLSRLETASYTIQTVVDVRQGSNIPIIGDFFAGDELLLIAHGTVVAGVDLGKLTPESVTVSPDGQTVTLHLPPAQIFSALLDSQRTRVYSRERGIFAPENKDLETLARQQAEQQILAAACEDGILTKATEQAEEALRQFIGLVDEVEVVVVPAAPEPCPTAPAP